VVKPVFDTQVAFNMVDRFGSASAQKLDAIRAGARGNASSLGKKGGGAAIQVVHAPVFYEQRLSSVGGA